MEREEKRARLLALFTVSAIVNNGIVGKTKVGVQKSEEGASFFLLKLDNDAIRVAARTFSTTCIGLTPSERQLY